MPNLTLNTKPTHSTYDSLGVDNVSKHSLTTAVSSECPLTTTTVSEHSLTLSTVSESYE